MRRGLLLGMAAILVSGCDTLEDVVDGVDAPKASLDRIDLIHAPTTTELLAWQCDALSLGFLCDGAGLSDVPRTRDLLYSFDLVFDMRNPNKSIPIPLVEVLLGMVVFDEANLGAVCISFCDPDEEECSPGLNVEGACQVDDAEDVKQPGDLLPTVDDLVDLAGDAITGEADDNAKWRVIPGKESIEAHIQFDLSADVMLDLADNLLADAVDDLISGRRVSVEVPYTSEGSLFFDVPKLGRHAIGFGPWDDSWVLE